AAAQETNAATNERGHQHPPRRGGTLDLSPTPRVDMRTRRDISPRAAPGRGVQNAPVGHDPPRDRRSLRCAMPATHESWWVSSTAETSFPRLDDARTSIAVLGGGIAGLTTAYLLARQGRAVTVVEADRIAAGVSG